MNKIKLTIILTLFAALCTAAYGQVTVGSSQPPVEGALLDLKDETQPKVPGGATASKGLLMPRVKLSNKNQLYPMYESDVNGEYKIGSVKYTKAAEDKKHIGLVVYNVDDTNGLDLGVHSWDGDQWVAVKSGSGSGTTYTGADPIDVNATTHVISLKGSATAGEVLTSNGTGSAPSWIAIPSQLPTGSSTGEVLKWNNTTLKWEAGPDANDTYTASSSILISGVDNTLTRAALTGDVTASEGNNATTIATDAVTTAKIKNANVTPAKIKGGTDGQVLTTDASGNAKWAELKSADGPIPIIPDGNGTGDAVIPGGSGAWLITYNMGTGNYTNTQIAILNGTSYLYYATSGNDQLPMNGVAYAYLTGAKVLDNSSQHKRTWAIIVPDANVNVSKILTGTSIIRLY